MPQHPNQNVNASKSPNALPERPTTAENLRNDKGNQDYNFPPLIREAQENCNYWRYVLGLASDSTPTQLAQLEVPDEQTAIKVYHRWVVEFHNRLKDYHEHLNSEEAIRWWEEQPIAVRTYRGQDHVVVNVEGGALSVLEDLSGKDDIKPGTQIRLKELTGLQSLIFVRRIRSTVEVDAGTAKDPNRTEQKIVPDWLAEKTLYSCHDGLMSVSANLGFVEPPKSKRPLRSLQPEPDQS